MYWPRSDLVRASTKAARTKHFLQQQKIGIKFTKQRLDTNIWRTANKELNILETILIFNKQNTR